MIEQVDEIVAVMSMGEQRAGPEKRLLRACVYRLEALHNGDRESTAALRRSIQHQAGYLYGRMSRKRQTGKPLDAHSLHQLQTHFANVRYAA